MAPTWSWASQPRGARYHYHSRPYRTRDSRDANLDASVLNAWTVLEGQNENPYGPVSDAAIVLFGFHCDAELTIPAGYDGHAQLDFGDGEVQTFSLCYSYFVLDGMNVEPDANFDRLSENPRYLRRATDQTETRGQPACSGTVRLLWLEEAISLILTPSHQKKGAYERLGILHGRLYDLRPGREFVLKIPKPAQRSSIKLV